jgi:hypothetical protein
MGRQAGMHGRATESSGRHPLTSGGYLGNTQGGLRMKLRLLISLVCLLLLPEVSSADAPKSLAGIVLGANVDQLADKVDKSSAIPLWRSEYLSKAPLKPIEGFRSGYVVYGNCKSKGQVVRIKLSYEDESNEFYNRLHTELTKKYGKPAEWRGNPFGTLKIWKWSLTASNKSSISIILERYEGEDDSFTPGNSIRLTNGTLMAEERACFEASPKSDDNGATERRSAASAATKDLSPYLPQ